MTTPTGRRERKKALTRQALADAALELFLEHGYDGVTVAQIADAADVSLATLFKHVPDGKEALIFDDGTERREAVVAAVRDRPAGTSVLAALREFMAGRGPFATDLTPELLRKRDLIVGTPALAGYQRKLWIAGEGALAAAIAGEGDAQDPAVRALARYVLEVPELAGTDPDPRASLDAIFDLLERGWTG
ncbi:TetR/AcrR family transcriptional regulator [Dactylosporangium sp. NBC_01737]|uniref:TetR/AcrR family transcriptional regulator n=1 Tax=Dactylosporangium sp. NBC_01737 TaxID=2975959 RepID=UPI002E14E455|nr:TetR/AcrR family transcriptional regulator [Dactylosporangium sp. NBC_01737]